MISKTAPVFNLILSAGVFGVLITIWGAYFGRDILTLGGFILIACCISAIARLVK
jgi:hypothetical protein